jgi:hypothetical protein
VSAVIRAQRGNRFLPHESGAVGLWVRSETVGVLAYLVGRRRTLRCADRVGFAERPTVPIAPLNGESKNRGPRLAYCAGHDRNLAGTRGSAAKHPTG